MIQHLFLYGAGPTPTDLEQTCRDLGLPDGALQSAGHAYLPDFAPLWTAKGSDHTELCAVPNPAGLLPGLLLQANAAAAELLRSSGPLDWCERPTLGERGQVVRAWTTQVRRKAAPAAPDPKQLQTVQDFLQAWGLDGAPVNHAAGGHPVPPLRHVFAYGTLRHGEPNAPLLEPASVDPGYMTRQLWRLGAYPVLTPASEPWRVLGELRHCPDLPQRLPKLDELEDFTGYHPSSMYWRVLGRVHTGDGDRLAWLWQMNAVPTGAVAIPSGDWRDRQVP